MRDRLRNRQGGADHRSGRFFSNAGLSLFVIPVIICLLIISGLSGCSAPRRAPVVSHDLSVKKPAAVATKKRTFYRVRKGDTLYSIAWENGLDQEDLSSWNRISAPFIIYPGQTLRLIPPRGSPRQVAKTTPPRSTVQKIPQRKDSPDKKSIPVAPSPTGKNAETARPTPKDSSVQTPAERVKLSWNWPTKGVVKEKYLPGDSSSKGVKISGRLGQSVVAAESGKVVYAGSGLIGYGRLIIIKHNKNYLSAYGYNRKILVKEGDQVSKGAKIAEMGTNSTGGSQLHFEIRRNGTPVDPLILLPRS